MGAHVGGCVCTHTDGCVHVQACAYAVGVYLWVCTLWGGHVHCEVGMCTYSECARVGGHVPVGVCTSAGECTHAQV